MFFPHLPVYLGGEKIISFGDGLLLGMDTSEFTGGYWCPIRGLLTNIFHFWGYYR